MRREANLLIAIWHAARHSELGGNFYGDNIVWAQTPFQLNGAAQTDLGGNVGITQ